ncbi:MerR family DNA-binding transcriptional regulator [Streptomyces atratus]|uniref:MerR family DNA-binding transcriptional regulator n=1 Tax=Streptomyces TaxID=1883 RepID=UPI0037B7E030
MAAEFIGLRAHALRRHEQIGLMPQVERSHAGRRRFSNRELEANSLARLTC